MNEIIVGLLAAIIIVNVAGLTVNKTSVDPKVERIKQWKRNKKKWAKHKFDV